jgi:hypothetical protein
MKKRFYIGLIIFAVLVLALGGLVVRSTAAAVRSGAGIRTRPGWARGGAALASLP